MALELAELEVLVDVKVCTLEVLVAEVCTLELLVAPVGTQIVSGVFAQISSQFSHEGFEEIIKATVVPNWVASLVQVSPPFAVYELQTGALFPLVEDAELEL